MPALGLPLLSMLSLILLAACGDDEPRTGRSGSVDGGPDGPKTGASDSGQRFDAGSPGDSGSTKTDVAPPRPAPDLGDLTDQGWELVWTDEFDGPAIDRARWDHAVDCWGGGNNEKQCYVADGKNSFIEDGMLHIVALADSPTGAVGGPEGNPGTTTMPHSSARLLTQGMGDMRYGRIEARIKLPSGQGIWPAFWMLPTASVYGGWAHSGEIDIMEAINLQAAGGNEVHGTLHYGDSWPNNVNSGTGYTPPGNVTTQFHTYAIEWEREEIRWYVDGTHFATQNTWYSAGNDYPAPFDQRFYIVLNLAVGGNWPGDPNAQTSFPQEMIVDHVRVFECSRNSVDGTGCGVSDPTVVPLPGNAGP